ncbi:MAG: hypothetical protein OER88_09515 [Planctomycetota bacterium]|nr:hypothetical protein [Planctomycetota bacterium]
MAGILERLDLDELGPLDVWDALDDETKLQAGQSLFQHDWNDKSTKRDAIRAIAATIRFREVAVQKMQPEKRAQYLVQRVPIDDGFASTLLMALHMVARRPLLVEFLDRIGVTHEDGLISDGADFPALTEETVEAAADKLRSQHPDEQVDLYLASLLAMDDDWWGPLRGPLKSRAGASASP